MRTSKRILKNSIIFLVCVATVSSALIVLFFKTDYYSYQDLKIRNDLAGSIDCLIVGASRGARGFVIQKMDEELNLNCYNLCGASLSPKGRLFLLEEELERNNVKYVILDVGNDDLGYDESTSEYAQGDIMMIPRLSSTSERVSYFLHNAKVESYPFFYATYLNNGFNSLRYSILRSGTSVSETDISEYDGLPSENIFLTDEEIVSTYRSQEAGGGSEDGVRFIKQLIELCKEHDATVLMMKLPYANSRMWKCSDLNVAGGVFQKIAKEESCLFFDFALIKNCSQFFSDKYSFNDEVHLSEKGAYVFTELVCSILEKIQNNEDVSDMFYDSYDEAITHMEYYKIYQELMKEKENG